MHTIRTKQDVLDCLNQERALFDRLVTEVGSERMDLPGAMGAWTFRDLIAHLTAWWRRELGCLEAIRRGDAPMPHPPPDEVELVNRWVYHTQHDRPLPQLLRDVDEVWEQFVEVIRTMDEAVLLRSAPFPHYNQEPLGARALTDFVDHYHNDHEADVRDWLARTS
jgi:hypothetical protein